MHAYVLYVYSMDQRQGWLLQTRHSAYYCNHCVDVCGPGTHHAGDVTMHPRHNTGGGPIIGRTYTGGGPMIGRTLDRRSPNHR